MSVDVVIEDPRWEDASLSALAEIGVATLLSHLGLELGDWSVAVLGCDDPRIAELNEDFRKKQQATNVLSWPSEERGTIDEGTRPADPTGDPEIGDIAISYDTCLREAGASGRTLKDHALHLIIHGTLHLLGYDHVRDGDGDLMEATEIAILAKLGVSNPYSG